jgi:hypothetical protein
MTEYITGDGRIAYVAKGRIGNQYTFYAKPYGSNLKGSRIKRRTRSVWTDTREQAELELKNYAHERGWMTA